MLLIPAVLTAVLAHGIPSEQRGSSVAVFPLEAKADVRGAEADLLTDALVSELRRRRAFERIITSQEVQAALGHEQQKQLLQCASDSCVAEVAGSLDVGHILMGNLGKLGESTLLNLRIISVREQFAAHSITHRVKGGPEGALDAVPAALDALLAGPGVGSTAKGQGGAPDLAREGGGGGPGRLPFVVGGGVSAALVPVGLVLLGAGAAVAAAVLLASYGVIPFGAVGVPFPVRAAAVAAGGVGAALGLVAASAVGLTAVALFVVAALN